MTVFDADYYDGWYRDIMRSPTRDAIVQCALGLPPNFQSASLLGWDAIMEVETALHVNEGQTLLDLACGRGGYGLEIAQRTSAGLVGVDFSTVAIKQARCQAEALGLVDRADFHVRELACTGLRPSSVDAVLCVDSIQFADPIRAVLCECLRVLKPGGRLALTSWQLIDAADDELRQRVRHRDLSMELAAAGFEKIQVTNKPAWRVAERAMWLAATSADVGDDPAMRSMRDEGRRALTAFDARQRVLATANAPGRSRA